MSVFALALACFASSVNVHADQSADRPLLKTEDGWVRGIADARVERYLGIPFAQPPLETLRFRPPAPVESWRGVRDAGTVPPICLQDFAEGSEDCLYLNVYRPRHPRRAGALPVMVWIHGGSLLYGSGPQYDPSELVAETDTIVVTINYRLNVFGFLGLPSLSAEAKDGISGNYGVWDQLAALRWVHGNVAAFGGAPGNVTIAGQSAGAFSVCAQLTSPLARPLFSRAILESGGCTSIPVAEAEQRGAALAEALGCTDRDSAADCLRAKSASELLAAGKSYGALFVSGGALLPEPLPSAIASGHFKHVPVLLGTNHDETLVSLTSQYPMAPDAYAAALESSFGAGAPRVLAEYPADRYPDPVYALSAAINDSGSGLVSSCAIRDIARDFAAYAPTYFYEFDDPDAPPPNWAVIPEGFELGSSHGAELAYLFDPATLVNEALTPPQRRLGLEMMRYWGNFIEQADPDVLFQSDWPRYRASDERVLRLRPGAVQVIRNFSAEHHCEFWSALRTP